MKEEIDYIKEKEAELELVSKTRVDKEYKGNTYYYRSHSDIDFSRVLYSSSARRLQGKMQLLVPKSQVFYRNRLTHSLEVSQIAKTIAKKLRLKDTQTVQVCSLAHDIGNPPFGHAGEIFLGNCSQESYEGNAQTFRILRRVEERHHDFNGLNLTLRTMLGTVKYLKKQKKNEKITNKKFLYDDDYDLVKSWLKEYDISHKTIDCEIMDIADEIAYAVHDLEDSLKLKYFNIDELLHEFNINEKYKDTSEILTKIVEKAKLFASKSEAYGTSEEYAMLFRKELSSILAATLINDVGLTSENILGYKSLEKLSNGLKKLTFKTIQRQSDIIEYEQLGKHVLTRLFGLYTDKDYNKDMKLLPANYRFPKNWDRNVLDYIGGMMDIYAIQQYEKYFGKLENKGLYLK
ncbi:deoxyguanosinetriphosphate triphosphohydrolase family protein [Tenacibaculum ovolyticum]|uniref:deoxyguanosinetriphosphate triphosphohydrolase family protein n=1 Tax=Tenacibaculum ovolyticum TaxID=104270 RepID=UPI0004126D24|nr:dNTP triphosphohydrolase [Tenacibaculum ovolyticum]